MESLTVPFGKALRAKVMPIPSFLTERFATFATQPHLVPILLLSSQARSADSK